MADNFHDAADLRSYRKRLLRQRDYQSEYRTRLRDGGRPERNAIAAATLRVIVRGLSNGGPDAENLIRKIVDEILVARRFDRAEARAALEAIVERERKSQRRPRRRG